VYLSSEDVTKMNVNIIFGIFQINGSKIGLKMLETRSRFKANSTFLHHSANQFNGTSFVHIRTDDTLRSLAFS
jgi:hypothetical protein